MRNKRLFFFVMSLLLALTATAQTNFRKITYAEALQAAKTEQKQLFIDFYTSWCGPCKMMVRNTFPTKAVGDYMNKKFVSIQIDAEKGEGVALAKRFKITAYPTFVIVNNDDTEAARTSGYRPADEFLAELERILNPEMTPEKIKARYNSGDRSAETVKNYAGLLAEEIGSKRMTAEQYKAKTDSINGIVMDYFNSLSDAQKVAPENGFIYRTYTNNSEQPAAQYFIANHKKFGDTQEVDSMVKRYFFGTAYDYLSYQKPYDAQKVKALEDGIKKEKVNADGVFTPALKVIEKQGGDNKTLFSTITSEFKNLDQTFQAGLISGLCRHFSTADEATKKAAARVIREQLPDMDLRVMYSVVFDLGQLEGQTH